MIENTKKENMEPRNTRRDLLFHKESYAIRGAVFEVYREMGCGFLEAVYQECMEKELRLRGIPFVAQQELKPIILPKTRLNSRNVTFDIRTFKLSFLLVVALAGHFNFRFSLSFANCCESWGTHIEKMASNLQLR